MRCNKAKNLVSLAMDEPLAETDRTRLGLHLEACDSCLHYQEDLHKCRELIQASEAAPSANFEWKVQLGIQKALREAASQRTQDLKPRRFWLPASVTAVAAALVIVVAGGAWLSQQGSSGTTSPLGASSPVTVTAPTPQVNPYTRDLGGSYQDGGATMVYDHPSTSLRRDWRVPAATIFPVVRERSYRDGEFPARLQYRPPVAGYDASAPQDSLSAPEGPGN